MAERRMFAKSVIDSDQFLDMPQEAQLLYFHLSMRADDDGFITPKKIMKMIGASDDSLKLLMAKKFVIAFDSGVIVIRHWRVNNYLRSDRYTPTEFTDERNQLTVDKNRYELCDDLELEPSGIPMVDQRYTNGKPRLGKDRLELGKDRLDEESNSLRSLSSSCSELFPEISDPAPQEPVFIEIETNVAGQLYPVKESLVDLMKGTYPAVDVESELKRMKAWAVTHPTERKTLRGMPKFINSWLSREQDKAGSRGKTRSIEEIRRNPLTRDYTGQYRGDTWEEV